MNMIYLNTNEWYIIFFILLIGVVYKTFLIVLYFNIGESYDIVFIITIMELILNRRRINNVKTE